MSGCRFVRAPDGLGLRRPGCGRLTTAVDGRKGVEHGRQRAECRLTCRGAVPSPAAHSPCNGRRQPRCRASRCGRPARRTTRSSRVRVPDHRGRHDAGHGGSCDVVFRRRLVADGSALMNDQDTPTTSLAIPVGLEVCPQSLGGIRGPCDPWRASQIEFGATRARLRIRCHCQARRAFCFSAYERSRASRPHCSCFVQRAAHVDGSSRTHPESGSRMSSQRSTIVLVRRLLLPRNGARGGTGVTAPPSTRRRARNSSCSCSNLRSFQHPFVAPDRLDPLRPEGGARPSSSPWIAWAGTLHSGDGGRSRTPRPPWVHARAGVPAR